MDAISFNTPYDEGEVLKTATWMMKTERGLRRINGFNEALDDPKHYVEKTWVGPKQTTRGGGNQYSLP